MLSSRTNLFLSPILCLPSYMDSLRSAKETTLRDQWSPTYFPPLTFKLNFLDGSNSSILISNPAISSKLPYHSSLTLKMSLLLPILRWVSLMSWVYFHTSQLKTHVMQHMGELLVASSVPDVDDLLYAFWVSNFCKFDGLMVISSSSLPRWGFPLHLHYDLGNIRG